MRTSVKLLAASTVAAVTIGLSPMASADQVFQDPYADGPLVSRVDWCEVSAWSAAARAAELASYAVAFAEWLVLEALFGYDPPPIPEYKPVLVNATGCTRARAYDDMRARRSAMLRYYGDDAALWQNRSHPTQLDSSEVPPDFVVLGFGDSFASGEGNPAIPTTWRNDNYKDVTWTEFQDYSIARSESDDPEAASVCHRSSASGFASAMMELRRQYSAVNVYWRNFACSGAETRHIWKDTYAPWKFFQAQDVAQVTPETTDGTAYKMVEGSSARQDTQIEQAQDWLDTFASQAPDVDATYMSIGGNDAFFGPVIGECVGPFWWSDGCSSDSAWLNLAEAALAGTATPDGTADHWYEPDFNSPGGEVIDPLAGTPGLPGRICTVAQIEWNGCISHDEGQRWSSAAERYRALAREIKARLSPGQVYLAEVPDFTRSDNGTDFCGDSHPGPMLADDDAYLKAHDPYARMNEDWLLSNSDFTDWRYASTKVGQKLVDAVRGAASNDGTNAPDGWRRISRGPRQDTLYEAWRDKHGVCALDSYVNTFEEAQDTQGEDMDNTLDVSAGAMHPNAFGQQDYAERILYGLEWQLVKKMTPVVTLGAIDVQPSPVLAGSTLGGRAPSDTTISVPWELNPYPNGDDRVTMLVRVTPITATIKAVPIASLTTPGSVSYALDYQKATTETASGDAGFVDVSVPAASAGAQIELRACGPESFDQDARLCTKWQSAGHFVRSPSNLFSPAIVAKIRQIERRLTESAFRRNLAAAATKLTQPGFVLVKTSTGTPKVWFEWKSTLGLTPLSTRDNAWKPPTAPRPPLLTSTYDTAVIPRGTTEEDLVNCGVPVEGADLLLSKLVRVKRGGLLGYGHAVATCLEYGDSVEPWPTAPPSPDDILESSCEMSRVEYEDMVGLLSDPKTDRAVFETNWEHVSDSLRCLQDRGVPVLTGDRSLLQNLQTCGLELLDLPILSSRFTVSEEQQEAINCLRSGSGRPPVYFYFLP